MVGINNWGKGMIIEARLEKDEMDDFDGGEDCKIVPFTWEVIHWRRGGIANSKRCICNPTIVAGPHRTDLKH
jgi:hypothetical protein